MASDDELNVAIWVIDVVAIPCVSILGIVGSSLSIIILYSRGLRKTSDLLLFLLAVVDAVSLVEVTVIQINRFHKTTIHEGNGESFFLVFLWVVGDTCLYCSLGLPVVITVERLIAIFHPFNFDKIMTRRNTLITMAVMFGLYASMRICIRCSDLTYKPLPVPGSPNSTAWYIVSVDYPIVQGSFIWVVKFFDNQLTGFIPLVIVVTGSIVIGVKVKLTSIYRQKLVSVAKRDATTSKTTKTLLSVCTVYSVINVYSTMNIQFNSCSTRSEDVIDEMSNLLLCVNSFCNYIIYVITNPNFRLGAVCKRTKRK